MIDQQIDFETLTFNSKAKIRVVCLKPYRGRCIRTQALLEMETKTKSKYRWLEIGIRNVCAGFQQ